MIADTSVRLGNLDRLLGVVECFGREFLRLIVTAQVAVRELLQHTPLIFGNSANEERQIMSNLVGTHGCTYLC